ncbi:ABC transporter ATP-binding protein [Simiduia agarivorans]|uniref:ABC transporter-like protein n=1 Tax=Simiduia agarivorans (strain DSM 21679 / JCM 13881 / BCRC 17597 / SA1) TaxID=1117647 RepID=K4KQ02_SIMAS|nr:ABC transporter ATP-binding protein [Simiduia agarivorans]AFV00341.1 ABC transporter-like protein [Simiduia agarivorans SA1 = DSM 21679]
MSRVICKQLCKRFEQGGQTIIGLDHVDLTVEKGEFVCLSGPSGSGKTTLLNAIGGLDTPDEGDVLVGDIALNKLDSAALADARLNNIGFVFQAYNLIPVLSARENVEFVMQMQGKPAHARRALAEQVLHEVGLAGLEDRRPADMSGGQQQRVAVARAIVSRPALVLADEPTANLDSHTAVHLMELFVRLNQQHQITFIIATHDQRVMALTRRLIRMVDGRIVQDGPSAELLAQ